MAPLYSGIFNFKERDRNSFDFGDHVRWKNFSKRHGIPYLVGRIKSETMRSIFTVEI